MLVVKFGFIVDIVRSDSKQKDRVIELLLR